MYKVIGIVGSPRPIGNTRYLVNEALEVLKTKGIDVELIPLDDKRIAPCEACNACGELLNCRIEDDFQEIFAQLNYFFFINGMIVPGSTCWNVGYGLDPESVKGDEEAIRTVRDLVRNMAWLIKKLKA
jgi:multimeric flavodoxin WrbA